MDWASFYLGAITGAMLAVFVALLVMVFVAAVG